jgi:hypothetical protein
MRFLLGCEESQTVCIELRKRGHEAFSCDLQPCSGGHPEWHIQDDILNQLGCQWDRVISFPPCTDLTLSGAAWFKKKRESGEQEKSIKFFIEVWKRSHCTENPMGILNGGDYIKKWFPWIYEELVDLKFPFKPSQVIQPYRFGDPVQKTTCLWLRGLPNLKATHHEAPLFGETLDKGKFFKDRRGVKYHEAHWSTGGGSGKKRSKTYLGIAVAMAEQWG